MGGWGAAGCSGAVSLWEETVEQFVEPAPGEGCKVCELWDDSAKLVHLISLKLIKPQ